MEEGACKPNIVSYITIIDSLCKDTMVVVDAMNLFSQMIGKGIGPNVVTYNSLIHEVCKLREWKEATRLLNEMVSKNIFPNLHTFNVLVDKLCKEGLVGEAKIVVEMMIQRDIEPNTVTYNSLMNGYCLRGEMKEAKEVFDLMLSKGSTVNARSYNILINGFSNVLSNPVEKQGVCNFQLHRLCLEEGFVIVTPFAFNFLVSKTKFRVGCYIVSVDGKNRQQDQEFTEHAHEEAPCRPANAAGFHPNDVYLDENFQPWDVVSVLFFFFLDDFEIQCIVDNMVYTNRSKSEFCARNY